MTDRYRKNRRAKKLRDEMYGMVQRKFISLEEAERLYPRATENKRIVEAAEKFEKKIVGLGNLCAEAVLNMQKNRETLNKDIEWYVKGAEEQFKKAHIYKTLFGDWPD